VDLVPPPLPLLPVTVALLLTPSFKVTMCHVPGTDRGLNLPTQHLNWYALHISGAATPDWIQGYTLFWVGFEEKGLDSVGIIVISRTVREDCGGGAGHGSVGPRYA